MLYEIGDMARNKNERSANESIPGQVWERPWDSELLSINKMTGRLGFESLTLPVEEA